MDTSQADELLIAKLRARGQRVTSQRLVIHRALNERGRHLTAEQLSEAIGDVLPGTSLPTVYATLELLEELGLVRRVSVGASAVLFEPRVTPHAHAVCRGCGAVTDVEHAGTPSQALARARRELGFQPDEAQLVIWGLCASCAPARRAAAQAA